MKFAAKTTNTRRLTFNDLGYVIKGVSTDAVPNMLALDAGESVYLANTSGVLYSSQYGDARKYEAASLLDVNDIVTLANNAELTITHNFKFIPQISVSKDVAGSWVGAVAGTDYTATTNAALTETKIKNISGGSLKFYVNIG